MSLVRRQKNGAPQRVQLSLQLKVSENCECSISMLIWAWKKLENTAREDESVLGNSARLGEQLCQENACKGAG